MSAVIFSTARITSGLSGDGGLSTGLPAGITATWGSLITRTSVSPTSATGWSGRMRQLTVARAVCGSAFSA
jgi:hypothetical protein